MTSTPPRKSSTRKTTARKPSPRKPPAPAPTPATTTAAGPKAAKVAAKQGRKAPVRIHAPPPAVSPQERHRLIEVAAYYIAERRGFGAGSHHDDWVQAEREVDAMIATGKLGP